MYLRYTFVKKKGCIPKCNADITFSKENKDNTQIWVLTWAIICFSLSCLTVLLYLINRCSGESQSAVAFASRTPVFLALTYVGFSLGYIISQLGLKHNPQWLCVDYDLNEPLAAQEGQRSQPCIIVFLLVYFFGSATSYWWTIVAFSWSLAQACSPKKPLMDTISMMCHMYGWGLPAAFTLVALLQHNIQADELTSVCLPGALEDNTSFLVFIVIPEGVQLALGTAMYLSGLCWAFFCGDATTSEKVRGRSEAKALSGFKLKFTLFGLLHFVCKALVFAVLVYEYSNRGHWRSVKSNDLPDISWIWTKIFFSFLVSAGLPLWVLNKQTKQNCFSLWTSTKKDSKSVPSTFPTVAYTQQAMEMVPVKSY